MLKKLLLILIGLTILTAGAAQAAYPVPQLGTLPFYWLTGRVTNAQGSPVANRQVHLTFNAESFDQNKISVTTDSQGYYRLNAYELQYYYDIKIAYAADNPAMEKYQLWVLPAPGDNLGTIEVVALSAAAGFMVQDLVLIEGGAGDYTSLLVKVVDEAGNPVTAAKVNADGNDLWLGEEISAGNYRIPSMPAGVRQIFALKDGYQAGFALVDLKPGDNNQVTIVLKAIPAGYGEIFGFVRDNAKQALAGALVSASGVADYTEINGWYSLLLPAGGAPVDVTASKAAYSSQTKQEIVEEGKSKLLEFTLTPNGPTGTISGRVTSVSDNSPIAGAVVTTGDLTILTGSDGKYTLQNVPVGSYTLRAVKGGFYPGEASISVVSGGNVQADFALTPFNNPNNGAISGYVRSAVTGERIAGVRFDITGSGPGFSVYSASDGFYFSGELAAGAYRLETNAAEYLPERKEAYVNAGGLTWVDFYLSPFVSQPGTVSGSISNKTNDQSISGAIASIVTNDGILYSAPTGADGQYVIANVPAGTYLLKAAAPGYSSSTGVNIGVSPNQNTIQNIQLTPLPGGQAEIYGTATDEAGNRLSRVKISVGGVETYTGTYGDYRLEIPAGDYDVSASSSGYQGVTTSVSLASGQSKELNFLMRLSDQANRGTVEGWVKNEDGEGISGAFTIISDKGYSTNFVGFYRISLVEPGTYTVYAQAAGYQDGSVANIVVTAGGTTLVPDIILQRLAPNEAELTGLVIAGDTGQPLAGARVSAGALSTLTNADGRYSLTVTPATYTIKATAEGYVPEEKTLTLAEQELQNVDFILWREKGPTTAGVVNLKISRQGDNIQIELIDPPPTGVQLYLLTGEGSGVYQNRYSADKWEEVKEGSPSYDQFVSAGNLITHKSQVGGGHGEAYYKALQIGIDPNTEVGAATFEAAPVVGKFNIKIAGGKNSLTVISSPFADPPQELADLFGGQLSYPKGADEKADSVRVLGWANGAWNRTSYFDGATLKPLAGEANRAIYAENQGIMISTRNINAAQKTLTLVGRVKPLTEPTAYSIRPDLNLLGAPYPLLLRLDQISLSSGAKGSRETADRIYGWANGAWNRTSYLDNDGKWQPLAAGMGVETLPAGLPSLYRSKKSAVWQWELKPESN